MVLEGGFSFGSTSASVLVLVRVLAQVALLRFFFLPHIIIKALTRHIKNAISGQIKALL